MFGANFLNSDITPLSFMPEQKYTFRWAQLYGPILSDSSIMFLISVKTFSR